MLATRQSQAATTGVASVNRGAFTLIELMIAVTLSIMIVYAAFAAFRVVGQTVATSKRMSVENSMLRTGFFAALDELDFWDLYDDRNAANPASNPLRAAGNPFCPITYDPTRKSNDPRTWWRGFGFASDATGMNKWGRFHELSKTGHSDAVRKWYPEQIKTFKNQLGDYGMISYLPGNGIYSWYEGTNLLGQPKDVWERTAQTPVLVLKYAPTPQYPPNTPATYDTGMRGVLMDKDNRPPNWPTLEVETRRYVVWSSFIDLCQVETTSPFTGETTRLSFWGVGTSLRGARQQRGLDTALPK